MKFKITTVVENTVPQGLAPLLAEHGLSFLIETDDYKVLFDLGQGLCLTANADALGINLGEVSHVVLSHGHFDHAGGLTHLLARNQSFSLFAHPDVFDRKLANLGQGFIPIGVDRDRAALEGGGIHCHLSKNSMEIVPGIITTGTIPMKTDFEDIETIFFKGQKDQETLDTIADDRALILDTDKGSVVILGCAHRGIINTLHHVVELTGRDKIHAVIGGLHLMHADQPKMTKIIKHLQGFGVEKMVVGHCTGFQSTLNLVNALGPMVSPNRVGLVLEF